MYEAYVTGCSYLLRQLYEKYHRRYPGVKFGNYYLTRPTNAKHPHFHLQPDKGCGLEAPKGAKVIKYRNVDAIMEAITPTTHSVQSAAWLRDGVSRNTGSMLLINLKGLTAAGKSSVVFQLIKRYFVCNGGQGPVLIKGRSAGVKHTYLPDENLLIFGAYFSGSGGCDSFTKEQMMNELDEFWDCSCHILYEGVIVSDTVATYYEYAKKLSEERSRRYQSYVFLHCSTTEVRRRLLVRNTTGELKDKYLDRKWSKFKYMPTQYLEWAAENEGVRVHMVNAERGVTWCVKAILEILRYDDFRDSMLAAGHRKLVQYYAGFQRKNPKTGRELLELSRRRSEQEDLRVHGRRIGVQRTVRSR